MAGWVWAAALTSHGMVHADVALGHPLRDDSRFRVTKLEITKKPEMEDTSVTDSLARTRFGPSAPQDLFHHSPPKSWTSSWSINTKTLGRIKFLELCSRIGMAQLSHKTTPKT
uniref:Uncharacterized protein n=1 Tax=Oryza sativa subsp. japonica TaxID=39947 RepID=Q6YPB8_ORYSJ|nr:hypothetical protein [Oryza sativa Japonica Group]